MMKKKLSILAGAGISSQMPTNLPLAFNLSSTVVNSICKPYFIDDKEIDIIEKYIQDVRLEMVFSIIEKTLGQDIYIPISFFEDASPNKNHYIIAELVRDGLVDTILTTNFDLAFEKAFEELKIPYNVIIKESDYSYVNKDTQVSIIKLHGTITKIKPQEKVQVLIENVGKPFTFNKYNYLEKILQENDLLVLGYSGRDDFDIYPLLLNTMSEKAVTWVVHKNQKELDISEINNNLNLAHIQRIMLKRGNNSQILEADTTKFLEKLLTNRFPIAKFEFGDDNIDWENKVIEWGKSYFETAIPYLIKGSLIGTIRSYSYYAKKNFQLALEISKRHDDKRSYCQSLVLLGIQLMEHDEEKESLNHINKAIEIAKHENYINLLLDGYNEAGLAYDITGEHDKAIQSYMAGLELYKNDPSLIKINYTRKGKILYNLGISYYYKNDFDKLFEFWELAANIQDKYGDVNNLFLTLFNMSEQKFLHGKIEESVNLALKGIHIHSKLYSGDDTQGFFRAMGVLEGACLLNGDKYKKIIKRFAGENGLNQLEKIYA